MADRTGADRPTPPQLLIELTGEPGQVDIALDRLRRTFCAVLATDPRPIATLPELVSVHVTAVL